MKKIIPSSLVLLFLGAFVFGAFGTSPAEAATYQWLSSDWYAKYYGAKNSTPVSQETQTTTDLAEEETKEAQQPATTNSTGNYWSNSSYYYQKYYSGKSDSTSTSTAEPSSSTSQESSVTMSLEEKQLAQLINEERAAKGLDPLILDGELAKWADVKTNDMIENNYFAHESPTYGKVSTMLKNGGVTFRYAGENIGKTSSVAKAHQGFMNSSVHRAAILNSGYTHVGIGINYKGSTLYVTEIFAAK